LISCGLNGTVYHALRHIGGLGGGEASSFGTFSQRYRASGTSAPLIDRGAFEAAYLVAVKLAWVPAAGTAACEVVMRSATARPLHPRRRRLPETPAIQIDHGEFSPGRLRFARMPSSTEIFSRCNPKASEHRR